MKIKKTIVIALVLMLTVTMCLGTSASYAKSLSSLQKDIKAKQEEIDKGKSKEKSLSAQLNELESTVYELNSQIASGEKKLKKLKKQLKEAQEKVDTQTENLSGRLRNMYKNGSVGFLDVLLNSTSFSEFLTNLDLVEIIYASDKEVLEDLQEAHDKIEKKKNKVEKLQKSLKSSRATVEQEMKNIEAQKKKIASDNKENAKMLDEMESEAASLEAELTAKSNSGTISNSSTSKYSGGKFVWPTPGYETITSNYGWRTCPFHGREFHGGIDIGAAYGSKIVAAASGTVISAGWNGGFGYSVQVDHGGGIVTMYNHCSKLCVSYGSKVSKGQTIAYIGSTGSSTGPHLDYRIFKNGETVNPLSYY